tara:strand:- start:613 stop:1221 length:609 start_codon:yes stop_codon:yes gene_type:complete
MLFEDNYKEIEFNSTASHTIKKSKFISYAYKVYNTQEIKKTIQIVKQKEPSANHHCYAYILNPDKSDFRFFDDGEPSYTAGRQILKEIQRFELTNTLIIVARYFGGIKLGISGLIDAYKSSTTLVIKSLNIITKNIESKYIIKFNYKNIHNTMKIIKDYNIPIIDKEINTKCKFTILISKKNSDEIIQKMNKLNLEIKYQMH